jgi:hypothetical protein
MRTFVDVQIPGQPQARRVIVANCEKGAAASPEDARKLHRKTEAVKGQNPDLAAWAAQEVFKPVDVRRGARSHGPRVP